MNRNEIEEKDRHLVKKIRTIVEQKERQTTPKRVFWKAPGIWLALLCIGLVVFGLTAFRQPSTTDVEEPAQQPPRVGAQDTVTPAAKEARETVALTVSPKTEDASPLAEKVVPAEASSAGALVDPDRSMAPSPTESETPDAPIVGSRPPATPPTVKPAPTEKPSVSSGIQISHLVTCGGVRDKQYIHGKAVFSLAADPMAIVWMRVLSKTPPFTLTHVYYLDGKHYCDVPLQIPYPHMRTWSKVSINRDIHIGQWHVDVVAQNGEILDQIEFTVVP
jgi:hypothetical protein